MSSPIAFGPDAMMTVTRTMRAVRTLVVVAMIALAPPFAGDAHAEPTTTSEASVTSLHQLLDALGRLGALRATFREEKRIALFRTPLISSGKVYFTRPGWISRRTERPEVSVVLLKNGQLTVSDPSGQRVIDVTASPLLRAFVEGFVHVLSGDRAALESHYNLRFAAETDRPWQLELRPKAQGLAKLVTLMTFEGRSSRVERMTLREGNGDETVTEFSDVQQLPAFNTAERARLFAVPR